MYGNKGNIREAEKRGRPEAGTPAAGTWEPGRGRPRRHVNQKRPPPGCNAAGSFGGVPWSAIFTDAQVSSAVFQLKRITEGILERPPDQSGCVQGALASGRRQGIGRVWLHQPDSVAPGPSHSGASLLGRFFEALCTHRGLLQPTWATRCDGATGPRRQYQWTGCAMRATPLPIHPIKEIWVFKKKKEKKNQPRCWYSAHPYSGIFLQASEDST